MRSNVEEQLRMLKKEQEVTNKILRKKLAKEFGMKLLSGRLFLKDFVFLMNIAAIFVSWHRNESILWAIIHYFVGFWYMIYAALIGEFANGGWREIINQFF